MWNSCEFSSFQGDRMAYNRLTKVFQSSVQKFQSLQQVKIIHTCTCIAVCTCSYVGVRVLM